MCVCVCMFSIDLVNTCNANERAHHQLCVSVSNCAFDIGEVKDEEEEGALEATRNLYFQPF